jgi:predicted AlkP superfamily pyrophosphatase or phosphodiesterase
LIREGTTARALIPVYPTNTFPNHYSIATGLYPARHGMINNDHFDPVLGEFFNYKNAAAVGAAKWWGGEPIWTTAVRQGRASASYFWVGSEAENHGVRPTFWKKYDYSVPFKKRLEELVGWLTLPAEKRPAVVTFYFEETNAAGHKYGPESPELAAAVRLLDTQVGVLRTRLAEAGVTPNFVIVSDHGMTPVSADKVMLLDDYIDLATVQVDFDGSAVGLRPHDGDAAALVRRLAALPHARAYLAADLPPSLHLKDNPRIPPVWIVPELGWQVERRLRFERIRLAFLKGDHGYDPAHAAMRGIFIASGPSFKAGVVVEPVENIHIYNLLCAALKLQPAPNDGDDRLVRAALK